VRGKSAKRAKSGREKRELVVAFYKNIQFGVDNPFYWDEFVFLGEL